MSRKRIYSHGVYKEEWRPDASSLDTPKWNERGFYDSQKNGDDSDVWANNVGLFHYLLSFDADGKLSLNQKTEIDFETMAKHIIAIDKAAQQHGLRIRKMLFHTDLQDNLYATPSGRILVERDINIVPHLSDLVNRFHDDHYHIDFEFAD